MNTVDENTETKPPPSKLARLARVGVLVLAMVLVYVVASKSGVLDELTVEKVRTSVSGTGWWGIITYFGVYTLGLLVQVPGLVFVGAAIMVYGQLWGALLGFAGTIVAMSINFFFIRSVGGKALDLIPGKTMKRLLEKLETHPVKTTIVLRLLFWLAPPVTGALALSKIRYRDFILGSSLGMLPIITFASIFFDYIFS